MSEAEARPLRILYVISGYGDEHIGGAIHREMAVNMRRLGHCYEIVVPATGAAATSEGLEDAVPLHRLRCGGRVHLDLVNRLAEPVFRYPWFVTFLVRLYRFLRSRPRPDVLIAEGAYPLGAIAWLASRRASIPYVVSVAGADFLANEGANYGYARYTLPRCLMLASFRSAAVVRAISPYAGQRAVSLGCPPDKLALVPRNIARAVFLPEGVDRRAFRRGARERIGARFGLDSEARLVVTVGRLLPIKGLEDLIRAMPEIIASAGDVRIIHVGPNRIDSRLGDYRKHLEGLAESLRVETRLLFAGAVSLTEVREFLAAANVAAVPSLEEGGNKTMLEAAAVGTPFVVTRTTGNAGWAQEWNCGLVVEPSSPPELAQAIGTLLRADSTADVMGENGLRFAQEFRTERVAGRMLGLCLLAAAGAPLPPDLREPRDLRHPGGRGV